MRNKVKLLQMGFLILVSLAYRDKAFAHHPNEGTVTLPILLEEAYKENIEIKEAKEQMESLAASRKQTISGYLPQLSLDGGYQSSSFDGEKSSGVVAHGTATVNLYRGGKDSVYRESVGIEEGFQKLKVEKTRAKIEREVSKLFYELLYFQEGIALKEQALETNKNQTSLALKKKVAGYTSQADVLEFELREATLKSDINFLKQEETIKERALRRLVGRTDEQVIRVGGHLERVNYARSSQELLKLALNEREDLKAFQPLI